jgi:predicted RNA-binding Zn ribbon-like protein
MILFPTLTYLRPGFPACFDFANTVRWHASDHPIVTLHSYADIVAWGLEQGYLTDDEALRLEEAAAAQPSLAEAVFREASALGEAVYRLFAAQAHGQPLPDPDFDALNATLARLTAGLRLAPASQGFAWELAAKGQELDWPVRLIAFSAAEVLTSEVLDRVGQCEDDRGCGWLFVDTSRNRSRRWCEMNDCGNRAKQSRHRRRAASALSI